MAERFAGRAGTSVRFAQDKIGPWTQDPYRPRGCGDKNANVFAIAFMGLLAAAYLYSPLFHALTLLETSPNEAWNAWYIDRVRHGQKLYPGADELIVNNYPPLSFYVVAFVSTLTSDVIFAGRAVSFLSLGITGISIAFCARRLGASWGAAAFGSLWFVAMTAHFFDRYVGINDPNLLALAGMGSALAFFLSRLSAGKSVEPAVACMVLAGFFKHSLIAIPVAALIWVIWTQPQRGLRASLFGLGLTGFGLALCFAAYGPEFFQQLSMPRVMTFGRVIRVANAVQWCAPALLLFGVWAWFNRERAAARFSALLVLTAYLSSSGQTAGAGVVLNAFFELMFATGIAVALAFDGVASIPWASSLGRVRSQQAILAVLVLRLVIAHEPLDPFRPLFSSQYREDDRHRISVMTSEIARIRAIPGAVSCSTMSVCYRAGKDFVYDWFWVMQKLAKGRLTRQQVDGAIAKMNIQFVTIDAEIGMDKKRSF